jgi:hypothetical protein
MRKYLTLYDNIEQFDADENSVNYCHIIDNAMIEIAPERRLIIELYEPFLSDNIVTLFYEGKEDLFSEIEVDGKNVEPITNQYTLKSRNSHVAKYTFVDEKSIGNGAFQWCSKFKSVTISNSFTSVGESAFYNCRYIKDCFIDCETIGNRAFDNCSGITSLTIGNNVKSIGNSAFIYCTKLKNIVIPDNVTNVGNDVFHHCSGLTSCTIGNGVTNISSGFLHSCYKLANCTIGSGVTSIGDAAFYECYSLTSITSNAIIAPTIESETFRGLSPNGILYVPQGSSGYDSWLEVLGEGWTIVEQ